MLFAEQPGLLERFRSGEAAALEMVYRAYADHVTRVVQAVVGRSAPSLSTRVAKAAIELEDLVQEVFFRAFSPQARARFDGARPYAPYLAQIARNTAMDYWRATRRRASLELESLATMVWVQEVADPANQSAELETITLVEDYLSSVGPELADVHEALYVRGLSQREAAAALGLRRHVVRGLEARLRDGLRRALREAESSQWHRAG